MEPTARQTIEQIPEEVLRGIIFSYIPLAQWSHLELVSHQFRRATLLAYRVLRILDISELFQTKYKRRNPYNFEDMWYAKFEDKAFATILSKISINCPQLTTLRRLNCNMIEMTSSHCASLKRLTNLTDLVVHNWSTNVGALNEFLLNNANLTKLEIRCCKFSPEFSSFWHFNRLKTLSLSNTFGELVLSDINVENLQTLDLTESEFEIDGLCDLLNRCINLECLKLYGGCRAENWNTGLNPNVFQCLPRLTKLQKFSLRMKFYQESCILTGFEEIKRFTSNDILNAVTDCKNLKELHVIDDYDHVIDETFFNGIVIACPYLEVLSIPAYGCQSDVVVNRITELIHLRRLCVESFSNHSNIVLCIRNLPHLQNLTSLKLTVNKESMQDLETALKIMKTLKELTLKCQVSNDLLLGLCKANFFVQLIELDLSYSESKISDGGAVALHGPNLRNLRLRFAKISDVTMLMFAENCKMLELLDLDKCQHITPYGVLHVLESCHRLHRIIIDESLAQKVFGKSEFARFEHIVFSG